MRPVFALPALLLATALVGCPMEVEEDPAEHACEVLEPGTTADTATAAAARDDSPPELAMGETALDVTLTEDGGGWLHIDVSEDTMALLFVDTADVVTGLYHNDEQDNELPTGSPNSLCSDVSPEHYDLDLHEGEWALELGPSALDTVRLLLISADGHGHEEHEHEE